MSNIERSVRRESFFHLNIIVSLAPDYAGLCKIVSLEKKKTARK